MRMSRPKVLVIANHSVYLPYWPVRFLSDAGAEVTLLAPQQQPLRWSRHVDHFEEIDFDAVKATGQVADFYQRHPDSFSLVVHCRETVIQTLARDPETPAGLLNMPRESAAACQSKSAFSRFAKGRIDRPASGVFQDLASGMGWIDHHGPSLIKINNTSGGAGVRIVTEASSLTAAWRELQSPQEFLLEEFESGSTGVTELLLDNGRILSAFASFKASHVGGPLGPSASRQFVSDPQLDRLAQQVATTVGYHGFCGFDWVWDRENSAPKLIEFHPRASSGYGLGRWCGVDLVAALRDLLKIESNAKSSEDRTAYPSDVFSGEYCHFPTHLDHAIRARDWNAFKKWLPGSGTVSWANVPWDDPGLLAAMALRCLSRSTAPQSTKRVEPQQVETLPPQVAKAA